MQTTDERRQVLKDEDLYFAEYETELRALICDDKIGMRFFASDWYERSDQPGDKTRAAFRLGTSTRHQPEFLSLWELFDETDHFDKCMEALAKKAAAIRRDTPYSTIVTCTATGKYILEQIHAQIETDLERVRVEFLPAHPFLTADRKATLNFRGQKVLIFTDVVASGSLAHLLGAVVAELGGTAVGVLSVVVVGESLLASRTPDKPYIEAALSGTAIEQALSRVGNTDSNVSAPRSIRIHYLAGYPIPSLLPGEYDDDKVIKIDPYSVYPEEATFRLNGVPTAFPLHETLRHWEISGALSFHFHELEGSRFLSALRLLKLFDTFGTEIWEKIGPWFDTVDAQQQPGQPLTLVCTFKTGDIQFKEYVTKMLKKGGRSASTCYVHRRNDSETTDYFFVPESTRKQIEDRHVVLLLSTVASSQSLRDLVSILASCSIRQITVICLVNRMGPGTCDFMDRIRMIFRGWRTDENPQAPEAIATAPAGGTVPTFNDLHAPFCFKAVYSVNDLPNLEILRLQDAIGTLFNYYSERTVVPSFRSAVDQVRKYFEPQPVTSYEFAHLLPAKLARPYEAQKSYGTGSRLTATTVDGMFTLLCHQLVSTGDYSPLIEQVTILEDRRGLFKLFALLLIDLSHLRLTRQFQELRDRVLDRVEELRKKRHEIESDNQSIGVASAWSEINELIQFESTLLFGFGLLSYLDHQHRDHSEIACRNLADGILISDSVNSSIFSELESRPLNLLLLLAEERTVWNVSLLLLLSPESCRPDKSIDEGWSTSKLAKVAKNLQLIVQDEQKLFHLLKSRWGTNATPVTHSAFDVVEKATKKGKKTRVASIDGELPSDRRLKALIRRAKDNLDLLLTELGVHRLSRNDEIVRFLHSHLISTRFRHSPLNSSLQDVTACLDQAIQCHPNQSEVSSGQRLQFDDQETKNTIEEAIHASGLLEQLGEAARQLFRFSPTAPADALRFADGTTSSTYRQDVVEFRAMLQEIRRTNAVSKTEVARLITLRQAILSDLFERDGILHQTLHRYVVPIETVICDALAYAHRFFVGRRWRFRKIWNREIEKFKKRQRHPEHWVLIDPLSLREILRNIFTNIRYTVRELGLDHDEYAKRVRITLSATSAPDAAEFEYVLFQVDCRGNELNPAEFARILPGTTLHQHQQLLRQFGGELTVAPLPNGGGTRVVVTLISRRLQAARLNEDLG